MRWISRLRSSFGFSFLFLITSIYWTQGFRSLAWMAVSFLMKDELKLSPSTSQFVMSTSFLPWSIKPLYGIFSDCVPIRGKRRIPYLIISSVLCVVAWLVLGLGKDYRSSHMNLAMLLTLQNFGSAMADVVVDAMVAEKARNERAEYAGDLQSLSWLAMAFGGIVGSVVGGVALEKLNVHGIFLLFAMFPVVQLLSCAFVDETTPSNGENSGELDSSSKAEVSSGLEEENWVQVERTASNDALAGLDRKEPAKDQLSDDQNLRRRKKSDDTNSNDSSTPEEKVHEKKNITSNLKGACYSLLQAVKEPSIFRPMLWFLLSQSAIPNLSTIMFYYQTNSLKLDASFLGTSRVVGWAGLMLGTFLYNHYLKRVALRKVFRWVHIFLAVLTLSDVVLVCGYNTRLGIPDKAFVLGASAIGDAVNQFKFMPFLVFSGQICPPGIEGTLFALFMSISNLGGTISSFTGAALASALGISSEEFGNLELSIVIQAICTILPAFFLFLIPADASGIATIRL